MSRVPRIGMRQRPKSLSRNLRADQIGRRSRRAPGAAHRRDGLMRRWPIANAAPLRPFLRAVSPRRKAQQYDLDGYVDMDIYRFLLRLGPGKGNDGQKLSV